MNIIRKKIKSFLYLIISIPILWIKWEENIFESLRRLTWIFLLIFLKLIKSNKENIILKSYLLYDAKKQTKRNINRFRKFFNWNYYDFKGIKIPNIMWIVWYWSCFWQVYDDIIKIYVEMNDNYSYKNIDLIENDFKEWPYCYISKDNIEILIKEWDIVIDAWARIGDFAAYASKKWAHTYAFEPSKENRKYLKETKKLNWKITIVPYWLGSKKGKFGFEDKYITSGSYKFNEKSNNTIKVTTLDDFVQENNINKIDFIKADIEWYERELLLWARNVLKKLKPILSICTYHLDDDEIILKEIILRLNPEYKIIQKKKKLFAYIPNKHIKKLD